VSLSGSLTCSERKVSLNVIVSGGRAPYEIAWMDPQGAPIGSLDEVTVTSPGTYTVCAFGQNGCSVSATTTVVEDNAAPALDLGPDRELTCDEPEIVLIASPYGGAAPYTYLWTNVRGETLGRTQGLVVTITGTYIATVIGLNGCSVSDTVAVLNGIDPPTVELGPACQLGCCGVTIDVAATISGGTQPYTYEWYDECAVLVGTEKTLQVTKPGIYLLIVRSADGCIASDSIEVQETSP
ncbi:hypothetical protein ACFLS0_06445, partial [Candidatus Bipolaricaulota bacterium]